MITLQTNYGDITIELDTEGAPKTSENFLTYVKEGFYDGTLFHRVIDGFMIQGGGMDVQLASKPTRPSIPNEGSKVRTNKRGTVAMARTSDPHSASSQFFINVADNDFLNFRSETSAGWGYCVFGTVVEGMDVVDKIKGVETATRSGHQNVPVENVFIEKAFVKES